MKHASTILIDSRRSLKFTESPRWRDGRLWFLDIHDRRIKTADLDKRLETAVELPFTPNGFGIRRDGSLLVGDAFQRRIHRWDGAALQPFADLDGVTRFCLSDGIVDGRDQLYVGDIGCNLLDPSLKPVDSCVIVCVDSDRRATVVADGLHFPQRDGDDARWPHADRRRVHGSPPDGVRHPRRWSACPSTSLCASARRCES